MYFTSLSLAAVSSQSASISLLLLVDLVVVVNILTPFDAVTEVEVIVVDPMIEFVCADGSVVATDGSVIWMSSSSSSSRSSSTLLMTSFVSTIETGVERPLRLFRCSSLDSNILFSPTVVVPSSGRRRTIRVLTMPAPLPLQSDMVGEASEWVPIKWPPFCFAAADADEFGDKIVVDDSCSFNVFTSFSANVARCESKEKITILVSKHEKRQQNRKACVCLSVRYE